MLRSATVLFLAFAFIALCGVTSAYAAWTSSKNNPASSIASKRLGAPQSAAAAATSSCTSVTVTWNAAANARTYEVERSLDSGANWTTLSSSTGNVTTLTDSELPASYTVRYRVASRSSVGSWTSVPSTTSSITCVGPISVSGTNDNGAVQLTWTPIPRTTEYEIQRKIANAGWKTIEEERRSTTYVDSTRFTPGATIQYRVRATNGPNSGGWSNTLTIIWQPAPAAFSVRRTVTSDAVASYCADVVITNTGGTSGAWRVTLPMSTYPLDGTVTSSSNVTTVSLVGTDWTVTGVGWNSTLAAGASTTWQYCAARPTPPTASVTAAITITQDWGAGYCASGSVTSSANAPITWRTTLTPTAGSLPAALWPATPPTMSNGSTVSLSPSAWLIGGAGWNNVLAPGASATFTWCSPKAAV